MRMPLPARSRGWHCRTSGCVILVICLPVSACVATFGPVRHDKARYVDGTITERLSASPSRVSSLRVAGTIDMTSDVELVFDARRDGVIRIPYSSIFSLVYGPTRHRAYENGRPTWVPRPTKYPLPGTRGWDNYLKIVFHDDAAKVGDVVLELGKAIVRPTLKTLEDRTNRRIVFETLQACTDFRTREDCGYASVGELKGLKKVWLDTACGDLSDARERIVAEIERARLNLELLADRDRAHIVLRFCGWSGNPSPYRFTPARSGSGGIYIVRDSQLSLVLGFHDSEETLWERHPARNFGSAFVRAYREAHGMR
jgi:hypothetical protein